MTRTKPEAGQSLTQRQRNLLLADSIARLSNDKRAILRDDATMTNQRAA